MRCPTAARRGWCCSCCKRRWRRGCPSRPWASSRPTAPRWGLRPAVPGPGPLRSSSMPAAAGKTEAGQQRESEDWKQACTRPASPSWPLCRPPAPQVALLDRLARGAGLGDVEVLTVDKCQGRDKDFVAISLVRSNAEAEAGEAREPSPVWDARDCRMRATYAPGRSGMRCPTRASSAGGGPPLAPLRLRPPTLRCPLPRRQAAGRLAAHQCGHHARQVQAGAGGGRLHAQLHPAVWPPGGAGTGARLVQAAPCRRGRTRAAAHAAVAAVPGAQLQICKPCAPLAGLQAPHRLSLGNA